MVPLGIPPFSGGIPPGTHLGSQVGLVGSHLLFLPGKAIYMQTTSEFDFFTCSFAEDLQFCLILAQICSYEHIIIQAVLSVTS